MFAINFIEIKKLFWPVLWTFPMIVFKQGWGVEGIIVKRNCVKLKEYVLFP